MISRRSDALAFEAQCILRAARVVSDLHRAESFYRDGLGFSAQIRGAVDARILEALGVDPPAGHEVVMSLGEEQITLIRFDVAGRPYPSERHSNDLWFQHLAIVVSDMDRAYSHLCARPGWQPVSVGGPQTLPPSDGSVRAFKFRDPDGHPLELLWFPPGAGRRIWHESTARALFLGIDHSAISVSSTRRSVAFYRALGWRQHEQTRNRGSAQARLDHLPGAQVRVTGLRTASNRGPGLELLAYTPSGRPAGTTCPNDVLTDWLTLAVRPSLPGLPLAIQDPDGHRLVLVDEPADVTL
jgi:catechol 2,3-dioxygenase-like lactoylglutathione lyase family enzyme